MSDHSNFDALLHKTHIKVLLGTKVPRPDMCRSIISLCKIAYHMCQETTERVVGYVYIYLYRYLYIYIYILCILFIYIYLPLINSLFYFLYLFIFIDNRLLFEPFCYEICCCLSQSNQIWYAYLCMFHKKVFYNIFSMERLVFGFFLGEIKRGNFQRKREPA